MSRTRRRFGRGLCFFVVVVVSAWDLARSVLLFIYFFLLYFLRGVDIITLEDTEVTLEGGTCVRDESALLPQSVGRSVGRCEIFHDVNKRRVYVCVCACIRDVKPLPKTFSRGNSVIAS